MATIKRPIKKAQNGYSKPTKDSTAYFNKEADRSYKQASTDDKFGLREAAEENMQKATKASKDSFRQNFKGDPGFDKNGYPIKKKKMKNGGSLSGLKASNKRVGPVDPKGAFTKVQKKTLAGAKGKASLTKDKQLGATKMAKCGAKMSKKK